MTIKKYLWATMSTLDTAVAISEGLNQNYSVALGWGAAAVTSLALAYAEHQLDKITNKYGKPIEKFEDYKTKGEQ